MPRRGSSRGRAGAAPKFLPRRAVPPPKRPPTPPQQRQPGLAGQFATTVAGVAVGSAAGHSIGRALDGEGQAKSSDPCEYYLREFLRCAEKNSHDLTLCKSLNEALINCKLEYGLPLE